MTMAGFGLAWTLFVYSYYWKRTVTTWGDFLIAYSPVALLVAAIVLWNTRSRWVSWLLRKLDAHSRDLDDMAESRVGLWIALAAASGLFMELMIIRLHSSYFQLFAYFKNVSLLSCFLGLGIGYATGNRGRIGTPFVPVLLALQIGAMYFLRYQPVAESLQSPISEQLAFGLRQPREVAHLLTVYGFLIATFIFNSMCFVPLGQLASRLMSHTDKLVSYSWNLAGSLTGIGLFYLLSYLWTPPPVWILAAVLSLIPFLIRRRSFLVIGTVSTLSLIAFLSVQFRNDQIDTFSPYQILTLIVQRNAPPEIRVNNVYYQRVLNLGGREAGSPAVAELTDHYELPYYFKKRPADVLIVGSGTGNDVAAAVRNHASRIDAVEIDPAIQQFGRMLHPESPYEAPNVQPIIGDARAFIKQTAKTYDLIVYGLLDSHTLLSGLSGVRLDSYVYTVEAFREARSRLKPGGLIVMTFSLIRPELGKKLFLMFEKAFDGQGPIVYHTNYDDGYTFLIGEGIETPHASIAPGIEEVTERFASSRLHADPSTDDWPFFYMPQRTYPRSYMLMIAVLLMISVLLVYRWVPAPGGTWSGPCFFLGAGFMLIETKAITELALVYGSTWIVIGIVIASILLMAFLANLLVMRWRSPHLLSAYGLLFVSLLAGMWLTRSDATLPLWVSRLLLTFVLTLPLFFSGLAFSAELSRARSVASALSSNLMGAMLGGLLEYNSMYFGFRSLYYLALGMYALALLASLSHHFSSGETRVPAGAARS